MATGKEEDRHVCPTCNVELKIYEVSGDGNIRVYCPKCNEIFEPHRIEQDAAGNEKAISESEFACNECGGKVSESGVLCHKCEARLIPVEPSFAGGYMAAIGGVLWVIIEATILLLAEWLEDNALTLTPEQIDYYLGIIQMLPWARVISIGLFVFGIIWQIITYSEYISKMMKSLKLRFKF